jgi:subtilisin family serine protease
LRRAIFVSAAALAAASFIGLAQAAARSQLVEVVVTLDAPPLAEAIQQSRVLTARSKAERLSLRSPMSVAYLRSLTVAQRTLATRITATLPAARVTWHYQVVVDGLAVLLPREQLGRLASLPEVAKVWPSVSYRPLLDRSPRTIGADQLWGAPGFTTAGNGIKIGIIDDGVDQAHPFFNPSGYTMPPGFPKGDTAYTTAKVIVARAFSPPTNTWKYARVPFDPSQSEHATHVAGIAAGDYSPGAIAGRGPLSGVAPNAYLGNYKVLTVPTTSFGLNGNAPQIAAGIEAAVRDGMDVINLSLGEPEIEPSRDLVVAAIDGAADAGVVPTIAAGNDFDDYGHGSISSPGSAPKAITAAAVSQQLGTGGFSIASFSSGGPSPISLEMKPDVAAPGVDISSSVPPREGTWASFSGTSMAAPHIAGAAALLRQRHPDWTVAQIKSALVLTGRPVAPSPGAGEVPTTREGGGLIDVPAANNPLVFAEPAGLSFGLLRSGTSAARSVELADAGGGAGTWTVTVAPQVNQAGVAVSVPPSVAVPGRLAVTAGTTPDAAETDITGFITLQFGTVTRRIPYWFRVAKPRLGSEPHRTLSGPGTYGGQTKGKPSLVSSYRYPAGPKGVPRGTGPEQVFRVTLKRPAANFGVAVVSNGPGVRASPRVVSAGNEDRLVGNAGLPIAINPYAKSFGTPRAVAGAIRPTAGRYDVVFETPDGTSPGPFTFRFWIDDVTPPSVRLLTPVVKPRSKPELAVADSGSGVDPDSLEATVDGKSIKLTYGRGRVVVDLLATPRGRHRLVLRASDYQELKNMENVPRILPNTRVFSAVFRVR